jgi:arginine decarboxylase
LETPTVEAPPAWSVADAEALYHVHSWGLQYFFVGDDGHVHVRPEGHDRPDVDVMAVVEELRAQGVQTPFLIRFQDLLHTRVRRLNEAFRRAIEETGYRNVYQGVFPVKVNQLREVVEEILEAGQPFRYGLECGSKAELVATLPYLDSDEALLVCNGYKDAEMMRLLRAGQLLGRNVVPILERPEELEMLREAARGDFAGDGAPVPVAFGVRVKLATSGAGLWAESGGEGSKFGLSLAELVALADRLRRERATLDFRLLHYHLGSQLASVENVRQAAYEAGRVYAWLRRQGFDVRYVDIGGGLGVTYEAGNADVSGGIDYSLGDYARAVVTALRDVCDAEGVPHPIVVSESGRAVSAYHSLLVVEAIGRREKGASSQALPRPASHALVAEADALRAEVERSGVRGPRSEKECEEPSRTSDPAPLTFDHLAQRLDVLRTDATEAFRSGGISLETRAWIEGQLWVIQRRLAAIARAYGPLSPALAALDRSGADHYLCDFSVFRSMVDHWAIGQRFPIMPLHRLDEPPVHRGTLVDLTCDSDGKVASFIAPEGPKHALELHDVHEGEPYFLGVFLMGAYQDIMGDMHNLFGRVTEAHVYLDENEPQRFYVEQILPGQTVEDILALVQYFPNDLVRRMDRLIRREVRRGRLRAREGVGLLGMYRAAFQSYTYVDVDAS